MKSATTWLVIISLLVVFGCKRPSTAGKSTKFVYNVYDKPTSKDIPDFEKQTRRKVPASGVLLRCGPSKWDSKFYYWVFTLPTGFPLFPLEKGQPSFKDKDSQELYEATEGVPQEEVQAVHSSFLDTNKAAFSAVIYQLNGRDVWIICRSHS